MSDFIKGMLIDFDGTLVDTLPSLFEAYKNFLSAYEIEGTKEEFHSLIGPSLSEIVARLKVEKNLVLSQEDLLAHYMRVVREAKGDMLPDLIPFLRYAKAKGVVLAVVTSAPSKWVKKLLEEHGIDHYFKFIVSGEEVEKGKPAPDIYIEAIKKIDLPVGSLLAVEDSDSGTKSAESAGLKTVFPNWEEILRVVSGSHFKVLHEGPLIDLKIIEKETVDVNARIEKEWTERLRVNAGLFNGPLLAFSHIEKGVLYAFWTNYKAYLGREWGEKVIPLSVTGITKFGDKILYGKRAESLVKYPGSWEIVPSGGLSQLDPESQLLAELEEEIGVKSVDVARIEFSKVIHNLDEDTVELLFTIDLKKDDVQTSDEVTECLWLTPPAKPPGHVIPLSHIVC